MAQTNDLFPPIDASVEVETIGFDFGPILNAGVSIFSVVSITCSVVTGSDPTPASRLIGGSFITTSPTTNNLAGAVSQQIGTMIGGVIYRLQCVVATSDGQELSLWTHIACLQPA